MKPRELKHRLDRATLKIIKSDIQPKCIVCGSRIDLEQHSQGFVHNECGGYANGKR